MGGPHPQSHVILRYCGRMTNKKRYISTFTNLAWCWLRMRKLPPQVTWHFKYIVTWQITHVISSLSQGLWIPNLAKWWLRVKGPHQQSHLTDRSSGQVSNQKYFNFTFTRCKDNKLNRVVTRRKLPHPSYYVTPQLRLHVTTIQLVVYICSASSWSSLLKINRFQMIVTTLQMCSLHKKSSYDDM